MGPLLSVGAKVVLARRLSCHVPRVFYVLHKDGEWLNNLPTLTKLHISTTDFRTVPLKRCYTSSSVDLSKLLLVAKGDARTHAAMMLSMLSSFQCTGHTCILSLSKASVCTEWLTVTSLVNYYKSSPEPHTSITDCICLDKRNKWHHISQPL